MYLIDSLAVLARRWYVVLVGVLVLAGGAAAVVTYVPTTWQSSGQMFLLLPPGGSDTDKPVNPYLNIQSGLTTAASLVSSAASTKDTERLMKDQGLTAEYAVSVVPGTGPLISVTAKDTDPEMATATRDAVMTWLDGELRRIQDEVDVPKAQYMSATRSSVSRTPEALPGSKLRALAALTAVVGLLTLVLTFATDRLLARRAARRRATGGDETEVDAAALDQDPDPEPADVPEVIDVPTATTRPSEPRPDGLVLAFHTKRVPVPVAKERPETTRRRPGRQRRGRSGR